MNLFVGHLPREAKEEDVKQIFEPFGKVDSVKIIKDKFSGESRGFCFVEMPTRAEAVEAIGGLNGTELMGQAIIVNEARPQSNDRGGGGRSWR